MEKNKIPYTVIIVTIITISYVYGTPSAVSMAHQRIIMKEKSTLRFAVGKQHALDLHCFFQAQF